MEDFLPESQLVVIIPEEALVCVDIAIVNDTILENPEVFSALLTTIDPQVNPDPSSAAITILDNDGS